MTLNLAGPAGGAEKLEASNETVDGNSFGFTAVLTGPLSSGMQPLTTDSPPRGMI